MNKVRPGFGIVEIIIGLVVIGLIITVGIFVWNKYQEMNPTIDSYQACVDAGNPVIQSYPEQCITNGKTFQNPSQKSVQKR